MSIEQKALDLGLTIPNPPQPVGTYVPATRVGNMVFTSGQLPTADDKLAFRGKVGRDLTVDEGYKAAEICILNCLGVIKKEIGSLDKVKKIVKVTGFVHSDEDFYEQPKVINGASDLLSKLFDEKGKHARAAVGVNSLPLGAAVEIEIIVEIEQ